jgi:hypothetical protein
MAGDKGSLRLMSSRAEYHRVWRSTHGKAIRYREFRRGVEPMRQAAQQLFRSRIGEGMVDGYTAANMLSMLNPLEPVGDGNLVSPASEDPGLMQGNRPEFGRVG